MTTMAERWQAEGEARGRAEGSRQTLFLLLERKFGALAADDRARIVHASEEQVLRWSVRVLEADSLAALFAG